MAKKNRSSARRSSSTKKTIRKKLSHEQRIWVSKAITAANQAMSQNNWQKAGELYDQILQLDPSNVDALEQLGLTLSKLGRVPSAVALLERAISIDPKRVRSMYMLACLIGGTERDIEAISLYKKVIKANPSLIEAHNNLGVIYKNNEQFELAIECFSAVVKAQPKSGYALSNLGNVLKDAGQMDQAVEVLNRAVEAEPTLTSAYSNLLVSLNYLENLPLEEAYKKHLCWKDYLPKNLQPSRFEFSSRLTEKAKLRIGYVSPDLHNHSVGYFIDSVFSHYDRDSYEVYAYYNNTRKDSVQSRFSGLVDHWAAVENIGDIELADKIYADQIDILVDLAGHTANNRLAVFYQKPAPVQVTWLGYPNTTGLSQIDYRISDNIADPVGSSDDFTIESLFRLETGFLCYTPLEVASELSQLPSLSTGSVTFGSFNNLVKISNLVISAWSEILKRVPGSRLLLKSRQLGNAMTRNALVAKFGDQGIDSSRLSLHAMLPSRNDHMALYDEIDIALDTFPYNGTTTTCEAMWMGVPTLTLCGDRHASRVGSSLMNRVGLNEFVAISTEDYIDKAVALTEDIAALSSLRGDLRRRMKESPLCQPLVFCQALERGYRTMWDKNCS